MEIALAQRDMCNAYIGGAAGILASSLVWAGAAFSARYFSADQVIIGFFIGGMFIHPAAIVLCKLLGRSGQHRADNPLRYLPLETTVWLIAALPIAYAASRVNVGWFFPAMMATIGARYLIFRTLFGLRTYWLLGASLIVAAIVCVHWRVGFSHAVLLGAAIEMSFAIAMFILLKDKANATP